MKIFLQKSKTWLLQLGRRVYTKIRAFFIKEVELGGQRLTGLEYRNIGATAAAVGVTGAITVAFISGVSLTGMARWMGFLPQEASGATPSHQSGPGDSSQTPSEKPRTAPRSPQAKFEIVEHSGEVRGTGLSRGAFLLGVLMNRIVSEQENTPVLVK